MILAAWGDSTENDEASEEEEVAVALMVRSESDSNNEPLESLAQLKEKVHGFIKAQHKGVCFTLTKLNLRYMVLTKAQLN